MRSLSLLTQFVDAAAVAKRSLANDYLILNDQGRVVSTHHGPLRDDQAVNQHLISSIFYRCYDLLSGLRSRCSRWVYGINVESRVENRRVWELFLRTLKDVYGQARVERFSQRYGVDFQDLYLQGKPLLSAYVKMAIIGSHRLLSGDLKKTRRESLNLLTSKEITKRISKKTPISPIGRVFKPSDIYGSPLHKSAWFRYQPILMDKELYYLSSDLKEITFKRWLERFSKCTVNKELFEKQIIPAPAWDGSVNYYEVHRKIAINGLLAYALKPIGSDSTLQPLVVFRPTQFAPSAEDALETFMNDFQVNIGEWGYSSARDSLSALMNDRTFCPKAKRVMIAGYSLGGTFAQRLMVDHWKKISKAFFFNSPSVEEKLAEAFAERVNRSSTGGDRIAMNIYRSIAGEEGDVAHIVGGKHLGWGIDHPRFKIKLMEFNYLKEFLATLGDRIWLHSRRFLDHDLGHFKPRRISQRKLNAHLDNESRGPLIFWYEKTRRVWGGALYWILYLTRGVLKPFGVLRTAGVQLELNDSNRSCNQNKSAK